MNGNKILVLLFSSSKTGNTKKLLCFHLKKMVKSLNRRFRIKILNLMNFCILPCIGCLNCKNSFECFQNSKDDVSYIFDMIEKFDHLILASPVYFSGFPSTVKALIDRSEQLYFKKISVGKFKNLKLKKGSLVLTCGSRKIEILNLLTICTKQFFDCFDIYLDEKIILTGTDFDKYSKDRFSEF